MRPLGCSFAPAAALWWGLGRMAGNTKQLGLLRRLGLTILRLGAAGEVFRLGYLVGSYKQGMDCTRRLVSLRTPLGGEIAALIREQEPRHPLLRFERPPPDLREDGSRPRIAEEPNRLAQIDHLKRELATAKAGQPVDRANERADERLYQMLQHQADVIDEIQRGGGPTAAAAAGRPEAARPQMPRNYRDEYEAAAAAGAAGAAGVSAAVGGGLPIAPRVGRGIGGGLVISDGAQELATATAATAAQHEAAAAAVAAAAARHGGGSGGMAEDPFALLLGAGSGGSDWEVGREAAAAPQPAGEEEERQRRRRERRKQWWWRHGGGHVDGDH
ncbi:hypothetical protein C2E20_1726 [Micractinium conductrix]|uniref:Uncharacterized protein n=1 Tax=Micractinium conductrix TaxID=554055 RepID=A0A2P6VLS4_9CHLO|nr:hypothetical protein C2E20_1726 [Micractinium conductrix]|eukprot:PSC75007.1 hypothetical protein C2E20_1726 [Micractinium conductrix]